MTGILSKRQRPRRQARRAFGIALVVLAVVLVPAAGALTQQAQLTAGAGAAGDLLGNSVAISGDTTIVGAPLDDVGTNVDQGSAYVFVRTGGVRQQQAQLIANNGDPGDAFGVSVAIDGDTAIVGAYQDEVGANTSQGTAYVFVRTGGVWTQQAQLIQSDGAAEDFFGVSVAISGDTAIVGAYKTDGGFTGDQGSAYVFTRSGTTWTQQAKLTTTDSSAYFGQSVAIAGDTAIVGAPVANGFSGAAHVFLRNGTTWTQQQRLDLGAGGDRDEFGYSVAISPDSDTAIVGAPHTFDESQFTFYPGAAYVYARESSGVWTQEQKLQANPAVSEDEFGSSVALDYEQAIVGATPDSHSGDPGSAYVFFRIPGPSWLLEQKLTASDGAAGDVFGESVAISGDTAILGAPLADAGGNSNHGSAYVFVHSAGAWNQQQKLDLGVRAAGDWFGHSVALSSGTAIAGAPLDDVVAGDQGSAYVFTRNGAAWAQQQQLIASDGAAGDQFGYSVAADGDTAIVGAWGDDVLGNEDRGSAFVFVRSGGVWTQQAMLTASDGAAGDHFGVSVAISGDTAIVGSYSNDAGATNQGSAYVFTRSGAAWTQQDKLTAADGAAGDEFGRSVALGGNTAIVSAHLDDVTAADQGSAYVFVRSGTAWTQQAKLTASDPATGDHFGYSVAVSGDTSIVGAWFDDVNASDQGSAHVFTRSGVSWSPSAILTASDGAAGDVFGLSVGLSGESAIVGAYADDIAGTDQGSAYVFTRSGTSWTQQPKLTASDGAAADYFGVSVAISGGTALVGAFWNDIAYTDQGAAYVYGLGVPTAVAAAALAASRSGSSVVLRWRGADPSVLGFRVYREQAGKRIRLTPRLIVAGPGGAYRYVDRSAPLGSLRYRLQAVRTDGTTAWAGSAQVLRQGGKR